MLKGKYKNLRIYYKKSTKKILKQKYKWFILRYTKNCIIYEPLRNILLFDNIIFYFIKTRY